MRGSTYWLAQVSQPVFWCLWNKEDNVFVSLISDKDVNNEDLAALMKALGWSSDLAFPALDVLRLAILNPRVNAALLSDELLKQVFSLLLLNLSQSSSENCQMLALRTIANMYSTDAGML